MLTPEDFDQMSAQETLDVIQALSLFYNLDQIAPESYRDQMTNAAEHLSMLRSQRWTAWAESKGIL